MTTLQTTLLVSSLLPNIVTPDSRTYYLPSTSPFPSAPFPFSGSKESTEEKGCSGALGRCVQYHADNWPDAGGRMLDGYDLTLPGYGILGDTVNELAEVFLNALTVYFYRDTDADCASRLLCQSAQQATSRGTVTSALAYLGGLAVSTTLEKGSWGDTLQAMKEGREGKDCILIFPQCDIIL